MIETDVAENTGAPHEYPAGATGSGPDEIAHVDSAGIPSTVALAVAFVTTTEAVGLTVEHTRG